MAPNRVSQVTSNQPVRCDRNEYDTRMPIRGLTSFVATKPGATLVESLDGLGAGFEGPQGAFRGSNPSDNSLAVGPDHIVQIVNSRTAIFTKKGKRFDTTGKILYGPVVTNNFFKDFGGTCESSNN